VQLEVEGLSQLKNPMTSSGIEPTTFWLAAYCLNQKLFRIQSNIAAAGLRITLHL
jgi:hypothetical protein